MTSRGSIARVEDAASRRRDTAVSAWVRMLECHSRILSALRRELADDVSLARFDLLTSLDREDGQTLASLSRGLLVTAGNLTGLVDRAARDGLVVRKSDARDRRVSRVYLTRKGRATVAATIPRHTRAVQKTLSPLSPAELEELRRLLGKLRDGLQTSEA
ncbi:MAG TPA: MarR family transcriptional regulator [Polyangiaceae bacterium]|nr:MarR family transcriptional regulator [Polyangiaceae bacterium]